MQEAIVRNIRRTGWSDQETNLLWETADEAQQQGLPLKQVFEHIARQTGRRPNSIRNYYYAQVQKREGGAARAARFVPFTESEVRALMENVLRERTRGKSVRSCLQQLAEGDHRLMLRYQNKYRSVIKARPELVREIVEKLREEGCEAKTPEVNHRTRPTLQEACRHLSEGAQMQGDPELIRACEVIAKYLQQPPQPQGRATLGVRLDLYRIALDDKQKAVDRVCDAAQSVVCAVKEYLGLREDARAGQLPEFLDALSSHIGAFEQAVGDAASS